MPKRFMENAKRLSIDSEDNIKTCEKRIDKSLKDKDGDY